jgi:murein DD-endopeptidase MepM/ murein hydrolase activator NlpD
MAFHTLHALFPALSGEKKTITIPAHLLRSTALALVATSALLTIGCLKGLNHFTANKQRDQRVAALAAQMEASASRQEGVLQAEIEALRQQLATTREELTRQQEQRSARQPQPKRKERSTASTARVKEKKGKLPALVKRTEAEVAIKEDPSHSGGLFVEPPKKNVNVTKLNDFNKSLDVMAALPLGKPVPTEISSAFGLRTDPLNQKKAFHLGLDFRGKTGDPVIATGSGRVKESGYRSDYGEYILISHSNGIDTFFAHLSKRLVKVGDRVGQGQRIGLVGKTGRSTGAHLHYEVHHHGKPVDPMRFVKGSHHVKRENKGVNKVVQLTQSGKRTVR